ncbi:MAG TPA: glycoside hydrolase [Ruminococcaceae bacterium]|nr:glycoside hydrolase [Oscillospiraceae bacterium]
MGEMNFMYKVGICAHFGFGKDLMNGQTDKSLAVWNALTKEYGEDRIAVLDTHGWKKHPAAILLGCMKLLKNCENIIMLPAQNGVKLFPRLFEILNQAKHRKLHYIVIGGWLPEQLKTNASLLDSIAKLDAVYIESNQMKDALTALGLKNVLHMPNFRNCRILSPNELTTSNEQPLKLCTFSRIEKDKGIEDAVEVVRSINRKAGRTVYTLDIYGNPEKEYEKRFEEIVRGFEPYLSYKGVIKGEDCGKEVLKNCFAMLFPTHYQGEGFAGAIIDAFSAGLPVIATDWRCNPEVIRDGIDGILYPTCDNSRLEEILTALAEHPDKLNALKTNCLERAAYYEASRVIRILTDNMKETKEAEREAVNV